jgi:hypothetical protein
MSAEQIEDWVKQNPYATQAQMEKMQAHREKAVQATWKGDTFWKLYVTDLVLSLIDDEEQTPWWALFAVDIVMEYFEARNYATFFSVISALIAYRAARRWITRDTLMNIINGDFY